MQCKPGSPPAREGSEAAERARSGGHPTSGPCGTDERQIPLRGARIIVLSTTSQRFVRRAKNHSFCLNSGEYFSRSTPPLGQVTRTTGGFRTPRGIFNLRCVRRRHAQASRLAAVHLSASGSSSSRQPVRANRVESIRTRPLYRENVLRASLDACDASCERSRRAPFLTNPPPSVGGIAARVSQLHSHISVQLC